MFSRILEMPFAPDDLVRALLSLKEQRRLSLLDSCGYTSAGGRLLIAGFDPVETIEVRSAHARTELRGEEGSQTHITEGGALDLLDERLSFYAARWADDSAHTQTSSGYLPSGACIATFAYDLGHQLERLHFAAATTDRRINTEPDAVYAFYDSLVIHDYEVGKTLIVSADEGARRSDEVRDALMSVPLLPESATPTIPLVQSNFTRDEYLAAVRRVKEHIAAGDIYQANLTQQLGCKLAPEDSPEQVFLRLRREHPAPFAAFIRRREDTVLSASPERFLRVEAGRGERLVEAWPIKGTRPRTGDASADALRREALQQSAKDRAENVMIVDLMRNDLGRVCHYGSVRVTELCAVQEHPTLFHLVSKVRGRLRQEVSAGDLLRATFPSGSITGAPKLRAMEIIGEVEKAPRGLSMGAIGYFAFDGAIDLSVAIRTICVRDGAARFNVGGGIVADSDPAEEYEESLVKARALLRALGCDESSVQALSE